MAISPPKFRRPKGRPSFTQNVTEATLYKIARDLQEWQSDNNRIASGRSINGWRILIEITRDKATSLGLIVDGELLNIMKYADAMLYGRGPGKRPRVADIMLWLQQKRIKSTRYSDRDLAYIIARKIGEEGTDPPHWTKPLQKKITQVNTKAVLSRALPYMTDELARQAALDIVKEINTTQASIKASTTAKKSDKKFTYKDLL